MSLKFGLWLVEQGLITCDQFCGLVKIQQDNLPSPSTIAFRGNLMTARQVASVQEVVESENGGEFLEVATANGYVNEKTAETIRQLQNLAATPIQNLTVLCGLMTREQCRVLQRHFQQGKRVTEQPDLPSELPTTEAAALPANQDRAHPIPEPKFRQRPVIVHQYDVTY